ncbi:hypothetical protein BH11MYX3_BH11MYX3_49320 [soil metagenome]
MVRLCLVLAVLALFAPRAHADDAVALLPLDADQRLEIYGQPVASEVARALVAGGVDVVVVGPKASVPDRAKLIVDGTISANKADLVVLSLRVRNPVDGTTLATTQATAQGLPNIDKAAAELSAKLLPIVKTRLEAMHKPVERPPPDRHVAVVAPAAPLPVILILTAETSDEPLRAALATAIEPWAKQSNHAITSTGPKNTPLAVKHAGAELGLAFRIQSYEVDEEAAIHTARARVRVQIGDPVGVLFDRVVITDTVVGDKGISSDALAARTAREVLEIVRPHIRRLVSTWR